jgi:alkanesulfonate monooxygenase SsuD/methylene tetrahydromethanopterin reductase-like flavin-dependent oxidoreductase (luciferase family)
VTLSSIAAQTQAIHFSSLIAGTTQYPFGISLDSSVSKLREGIRVTKALWNARDGRIDFSGKYFSLKGTQPPMFLRSAIPIYVASYGPKMLELTAELADGLVPESHTPETYERTINAIREKMKGFGGDPKKFHGCCALVFHPWDPDDKAHVRILRAAKGYLTNYPDIQWTAGAGRDHPGM